MSDNEDFERSIDAYRRMPIFRKAEAILKLVEHIVDGISKEDSDAETPYELAMYERHAQYMMQNALLIPAKIASASGVDIYDLRMENATLIRKAAREIITDTRGLQMAGFKEEEYLDLLRKEIEEFRPLFAEWVKSFDPFNYIIDRWGLFNPPGVNYDDHDPQDDIPFDPKSFFEDFEDDDQDE